MCADDLDVQIGLLEPKYLPTTGALNPTGLKAVRFPTHTNKKDEALAEEGEDGAPEVVERKRNNP